MAKKIKLDTNAQLLAWAAEQGARITHLEISESLDCRGAVAVDTIQNNTEICFIPSSILLSESVAMHSEIGKCIREYLGSNEDELRLLTHDDKYMHSIEIVCMAAFIVYEKNEKQHDSFWFPYLNSLPASYELPVCWSDATAERLLKGTALGHMTTEKKIWLRNVVQIIGKCTSEYFTNSWNEESFLWAYCTISSRAFPKSRQEQSNDLNETQNWITISEICLYPVLDLLNHRRGHKIEWKMSDEGVSFISGEPVMAGTQVFNNYGPKGNENLLGNYGFVLDDNAENYFKMFLNTADSDPQRDCKLSLLNAMTPSGRSYMLFADDTDMKPEAIAVTRLLVANIWELACIHDKFSNDIHSRSLSIRNEMVTFQTLHSLLAATLATLKKYAISETSNDEYPQLTRMASIYRNGQISIVEHGIKNCIDKIKELSGSSPESIFFSLRHPIIDPGFLKQVQDLGFDSDTMLNIMAVKYGAHIGLPIISPEQRALVLGDSLSEFREYFNEELAPEFADRPDLFDPNLFNIDSMINSACLMDMFGAELRFDCIAFGNSSGYGICHPRNTEVVVMMAR